VEGGWRVRPCALDLIQEVLDRSRDVCKTLYKAPRMSPLGYHDDYLKNGAGAELDMPQLAAYAALFYWRVRPRITRPPTPLW